MSTNPFRRSVLREAPPTGTGTGTDAATATARAPESDGTEPIPLSVDTRGMIELV